MEVGRRIYSCLYSNLANMMKNRNRSVCKLPISIMAVLLSLSSVSFAEESAYEDLNACTKDQQIKLTAKGVVAGALTGLGAAFLSGKKDDAGKAAVVGAVVGGAAGFATAYYTAMDSCIKLNPSWVLESQIVRDPKKSYSQVNKENKYTPKEGVKVLAKKIDMATSIKPGSILEINSTFDLMTPDGAETPVVIERKLFAVADGKETATTIPGKSLPEEHTTAAGRSKDSVKLPIAQGMASGSVFRVEFSVAAGGKPPSVVSKTFTVL